MEVDLIPLSQLPSRYGIARSNLYNRLKDLQIEPIKQGKKAFVNGSQLELLDRLHNHLQQGGITSEFIKEQRANNKLAKVSIPQLDTNNSVSLHSHSEPMIALQPTALVSLVEAVVKRLMPTPKNRLSYLRELEEAYQNGWLLSTSEVADLLGLSQKTITGYGQEFTDAGFVFCRAGIRKGGEIAWAIDKQTNWVETKPASEITIKEAFSSVFDPEEN
jgi:hypothetical protein